MSAHDPELEIDLSSPHGEERERSLKADLQSLAQDAKAYAESEFQFQKSRTAYAASAIKSVIVFAIVAAVLAFFAVMAIVVGLVIALTPLVTAWGATAIVAFGLLILAGLLVLRAKRRLAIIMTVFSNGGER